MHFGFVLQCFPSPSANNAGCDLMHFGFVLQSASSRRSASPVVIWCTLDLSCNRRPADGAHRRLWFDALWICLAIHNRQSARNLRLWFDALWICLAIYSIDKAIGQLLWFDALWICLAMLITLYPHPRGCDLMHFGFVLQCVFGNDFWAVVVIWCTLDLSCNSGKPCDFPFGVVIWCTLDLSCNM